MNEQEAADKYLRARWYRAVVDSAYALDDMRKEMSVLSAQERQHIALAYKELLAVLESLS